MNKQTAIQTMFTTSSYIPTTSIHVNVTALIKIWVNCLHNDGGKKNGGFYRLLYDLHLN